MSLGQKVSDIYDENALFAHVLATAVRRGGAEFEYPDWSHRSMRDLALAFPPELAISVLRTADPDIADAGRDVVFMAWLRTQKEGRDELLQQYQSGGMPAAFHEVMGRHPFNDPDHGIFACGYLDRDGRLVRDTAAAFFRAMVVGQAWGASDTAALIARFSSDEIARVLYDDRVVIHSLSEDGFWSNEDGWGAFETATVFGAAEDLSMPMSTRKDARVMSLSAVEIASQMQQATQEGMRP